MNYYLVPSEIAESLQLTEMRKSTRQGMYLLSEYDLQPYGVDRAISEGAIEMSDNRPPLPGIADTAQPDQGSQGDSPEGGDTPSEAEDIPAGETDAPSEEDSSQAGVGEEQTGEDAAEPEEEISDPEEEISEPEEEGGHS